MRSLTDRSRVIGFAVLFIGAFVTALVHAGSSEAPRDALTRLAGQLERGETTLEYREGSGYLPSLLEHLDVHVDTQTLVFSKTSFQQTLINPKNPRALYFNDQVAIGDVPGGDVYELLALEPSEGMVFYSLQIAQTERPQLRRRGIECLFCHALGNRGAPSLFVASVIPAADGTPAYTGTFLATIDHRTPFDERWGGWYVTGTHGSQRHMGNAVAPDLSHPLDLDQTNTQNLTSLDGRFDATKYLTASSDIVALMTLEHQVGAVNRINALRHQYDLAKAGGFKDADWARLDNDIDDLVGYMLLVDEAPLTDPVKGVSTFTRTFPERGPRDAQGRSLRDFDLRTRLFRYPLSYMVYSEQLNGLPGPIRERFYRRLYDVLIGKDTRKKYEARSAAERQTLLQILLETKSDLPSYWSSSTTTR
jgi:hypothetical protein